MRKLDLTIPGIGAHGRVQFDGEDVRARAFTIQAAYDDVTQVTIDMLTHDWEPRTVSGIFIPDDDPDYAIIREVLASTELLRFIRQQKRENDEIKAVDEAKRQRLADPSVRDVTVMGDTNKKFAKAD